MTYVAAAKTSEIAPGGMKAVKLNSSKILLANVGGEFHAIQAECPHLKADLCKGKLQGAIVTCPMHSAGFDVRTGAAVDPAKVLFLKMKTKDARSFAVKVEGDQILVAV